MEPEKICACIVIRQAGRALTKLYDQQLKSAGLRVTQLALLNKIIELKETTMLRLAEATLTDRTTLARNLKPLARDGMIQVETGTDLRERRVTITEHGIRKFNEALPLWEEAQSKVFGLFGKKRLDNLLVDLMELTALTREKR